MISHDFFDDEIIDNLTNRKSKKVRTSILCNEISQEMFKEAKNSNTNV